MNHEPVVSGGEDALAEWALAHESVLAQLPARLKHDLIWALSCKLLQSKIITERKKLKRILDKLEILEEKTESDLDVDKVDCVPGYVFKTGDDTFCLHVRQPYRSLCAAQGYSFLGEFYKAARINVPKRSDEITEFQTGDWTLGIYEVRMRCKLILSVQKRIINTRKQNLLYIIDRLVDPESQGKGVGKHLLAIVDAVAALNECELSIGKLVPHDKEHMPLLKRGHRQAGYRVRGNIAVKFYQKSEEGKED